MAAVHSSRQRRLRSSSDPFVDPSPLSSPPPPPPKTAGGDITQAVRDTVTVRTQDSPARSKMSRSQTNAPSSSNSRPSGKRSQSEDSGHVAEKPRNGKPRAKKGSQHADVIDRLDFTSVGPMFHHDGPFDACAPSRNKHRNKAPMYAWGDDLNAAQLSGSTGSAYPSAHAYAAFSNDYPDPPKKKVDALAEAWGIHEPEPFEDFAAGGGSGRLDGDTPTNSIYNGKESHTRNSRRPPKDNREKQRRSTVPPPQPIFVGEPAELEDPGSPPSPGNPKRSKSIMQRIRKMRDAPNVPVGRNYEMPPSSPTSPLESTRPTHRSQNSFLGRFAGGSRATPQTMDKSEPFVFIDPQSRETKDLPPAPVIQESVTPPTDNDTSTDFEGQSGGGLGRKSSLIKKMGKVVRAGPK